MIFRKAVIRPHRKNLPEDSLLPFRLVIRLSYNFGSNADIQRNHSQQARGNSPFPQENVYCGTLIGYLRTIPRLD